MRGWAWALATAAVLLAGLGVVATAQQAGDNDRAALVRGNSAFAFDLYGRLDKKDGNFFFSPYSITTALAMTYAGARGETAAEMARTLHFTLPPARLHDAFAALRSELHGDAKKRQYRLHIANRLWGQKGYHFLPEFLQLTKTRHGAALAEADFAGHTEEARQAINAWVEKQTNDKIKDIIAKGVLDPGTRLVLANAIYFKAAWAHAFPEKGTREEAFRLSADKSVKVPMMHQVEDCPYHDGDTFTMVSLPYAGYDLSMLVLLPKKMDGLAALEKSLTDEHLSAWLKKMQPRQVTLTLPKFKMTSKFSLEDELARMGMPLAFGGSADFSGMTSEEKLFISKVIHQAFVDVNEKGTEAAAATVIILAPTGLPVQLPRATFRADHPFVILIRDTRTGSILFMGRVADPLK
jgi:serpin B